MKKISNQQALIFKNHLKNFYQKLLGKPCLIEFEFDSFEEDWIFRVKKDNVLTFNLSLFHLCSERFYLCVIIHELYHYIKHKILDKSEVKILRDLYSDLIIRAMDVEADLYAAIYFKEELNYSYSEYIELLYEGRKVFISKNIRFG